MVEMRQAAVEQMNRPTLDKLRQFETAGSDTRATNLRHYYKVGQLYTEMRDNPDKYKSKDGLKTGVALIEQALSLQARVLRKAATFVDMYSEHALEKLIGLYNKGTNFQLHWGHVTYLLTVEDKDKRNEYALEAVTKMLDPPALHAFIKKKQKRSGGHGRKHELPATPAAQVRQINTMTSTWNSKAEQVWDGEEVSVMANLLELAPDQVDEDMLTSMKDTAAQLRLQADRALSLAGKLDRAIEHGEGVLKERRKQEAAAIQSAESGRRESRSIDLGEEDKPKRSRRAG